MLIGNFKYVCAYYMHMVKVISLSEEAYHLLKMAKREGMSFSDIILNYFGKHDEKTESLNDLIAWASNLKAKGKKIKASTNVDEIVYGVGK